MNLNDADRLDLPTLGPEGLHETWDQIEEDRVLCYYDRSGNRVSMRDWARLREYGGHEYIAVKQEEVGEYWVSTVWIGLDHSYSRGEGPPIIFETMVFKGDTPDLDCERYATEEEALAGHERMVEKVRLFAAAAS